MTHTSRPPSRALPNLSVCRLGSRSSRSDILPTNSSSLDGTYFQQHRGFVARIAPEDALSGSGRQLRKAGAQRAVATLEQALNAGRGADSLAGRWAAAAHP